MSGEKKCVVIGNGSVGKTSMLVTFVSNEFPFEYVKTVFDNHSAKVKSGDEEHTMTLYDTAGQEDFANLRKLSYGNTDVFAICFSVMNPTSFNDVKKLWQPEIRKYAKGTPYILVGTKIDCRANQLELEELQRHRQRPVSFEDGLALAKDIGAAKYVECSALANIGLQEVFETALEVALNKSEYCNTKSKCCP